MHSIALNGEEGRRETERRRAGNRGGLRGWSRRVTMASGRFRVVAWGACGFVAFVVAAAARGHLVQIIAPIVQRLQIIEAWLPVEILQVPLAAHGNRTALAGHWFSSITGA